MTAQPNSRVDEALSALADPNRRSILAVVRSGSRPVGQIAAETGLSQQATTYHLGVLRSAGLVSGRKDGTRHLFSVDTDGLAAVRGYLDQFWPDRLTALKAAVESDAGPSDG